MDVRGTEAASDIVGWVVILDSTVWCVGCAPTVGHARERAGIDAGNERVRVAPAHRGWADVNDATCDGCGLALDR